MADTFAFLGYEDVKENTDIPETIEMVTSDSDNDSKHSNSRMSNFPVISTSHVQTQNRAPKKARWNYVCDISCDRNEIITKILQKQICKKPVQNVSFYLLDQPQNSIRPTYSNEGNRGTLKARNGENLQLQTMIPNSGFHRAIVLANLVNENGETARDFQLSVTERPQNISEIISGMENDLVLFMNTAEHIVDVHFIQIKRKSTKKVKELERTCKLHFRLIVVGDSYELFQVAELYSDAFSIEQASGPPKITELSQLDDCHVIIVEGKNFRKGSTKIFFDKAEAKVHPNMNKDMACCYIPESYRYQIPDREISIYVQVDGRKSEPKSFKIKSQNLSKKADIFQTTAQQFAGNNTLTANFCPDLVRSAPEYVSERYDSQLWRDYGTGSVSIHLPDGMEWNSGAEGLSSTSLSSELDILYAIDS